MIKNIVFDIGNVLVRFRPDEAMRNRKGICGNMCRGHDFEI